MANKNISGDVNVEFTEAQSRQSLESGESVKTLFGKLRKWLTDLKPVAYSGSYNDLSNKPTIPDISGKVNKSGDTMTGDLTFNVAATGGGYKEAGIKSSTANSQVSVSNNQSKMVAGNELGSYASVSARNGASVKAVTIEAYSDTDDAYTSFEVAQDGVFYNDDEVATTADLNSYLPLTDNAGFHNGIYRGKDLTNIYTVEEIYERVHNGTFEDLYIGDYITKEITYDIYSTFTGSAFVAGTTYYERSGVDLNHWVYTETSDTTYDSGKTYYTKNIANQTVNLAIMAFNYFMHTGDSLHELKSPHLIMGLRNRPSSALAGRMNATNSTMGGYYNSEVHQTTLPCLAKSIKQVLNGHILPVYLKLSTEVNATIPSNAGLGMMGASSNSAWVATELFLPNSAMVTGQSPLSSSINDILTMYTKLPYFNFHNASFYDVNTTYTYWLSDVVNTTQFAWVTSSGYLYYSNASGLRNLRPMFVFGDENVWNS